MRGEIQSRTRGVKHLLPIFGGWFIPVGEQVRYDGANFRKGQVYGPEKVVVAG
jgi:hypothetical protein